MKKTELEKILRKVLEGFNIPEENFQLRLEIWWSRFSEYEPHELEEAFKYLPEISGPYRPPFVKEAVDCFHIYKYFGGVN